MVECCHFKRTQQGLTWWTTLNCRSKPSDHISVRIICREAPFFLELLANCFGGLDSPLHCAGLGLIQLSGKATLTNAPVGQDRRVVRTSRCLSIMAVIQMPESVMTPTSEWLCTPKTDSDSQHPHQHRWTHAINTCIYSLWLKEQVWSVRGYSAATRNVRYDLFHEYVSVPPSAKQNPLLFLCLPRIQTSCSKVKTHGMACPLDAFCNSFLQSLSVFLKTGQGMQHAR